MREWLFPLAPLIAVVYYLIYPYQFAALIHWIGVLVR